MIQYFESSAYYVNNDETDLYSWVLHLASTFYLSL